MAHNASFDARFLDAELQQISRTYAGSFACSMLISRRLYQQAPCHKLGVLVEYKSILTDGVFHRALADAEMTARLWFLILDDLQSDHGMTPISFSFMKNISRMPKGAVSRLLKME